MASSSRTIRLLGRGAGGSSSNSRLFHQSSRQQKAELPRHAIAVGPTQLSRMEEYYHDTLARDLLYMSYVHPSPDQAAEEEESSRSVLRSWDPASPYSKNRPTRPNRGNRMLQPSSLKYDNQVVRLDRIVITAFCKDAIANKQNLIPLLAQMRAITGKPILGSLADPSAISLTETPKNGYIKVIRSKAGAASFKIRPGMPVGVQAVLPSKSAYNFLEIFTTFVLPRLRTFNGFLLPPSSEPASSPAAMSGVVSLGMIPEALSLFPQTEVNWDTYPNRPVGFQVDCITNQRGKRATEKARQLLSGLGVPFMRRVDQ